MRKLNCGEITLISINSSKTMEPEDAMVHLLTKLKSDKDFLNSLVKTPSLDIKLEGRDLNTGTCKKSPFLFWIRQNQPGSLLLALSENKDQIKLGRV